MNIILSVWAKKNCKALDYIDLGRVERLLPIDPKSSSVWNSSEGRATLVGWQVGPCYEGSFTHNNDLAVLVDGILLPCDEKKSAGWLADYVVNKEPLSGYGEFVLVWASSDGIGSFSNIGASHNLYYVESDEFVAISNRSVCLLGLPGISPDLDIETIRWKAFQGYAFGDSTAFSEVKKIPNGSRVDVTDGQVSIEDPAFDRLISHERKERFLFNPKGMIEDEIDALSGYMVRAFSHSEAESIDVALSGGKDSRVILALVRHAGLLSEVGKIWTRGPHYSPEVLAARDVCSALGIREHEVRRPPVISSALVTAGVIVRSISNHEGMLSLYDFAGIGKRSDFRFHGHELGLRAGRFSKANEEDIEGFIKSASGVWSNPLSVVHDPNKNFAEIEGFFRNAHGRGVPVSDLGDVYSVFERLPSWAAVMSMADYCSGFISNPLLHNRVIELVFSLPPEFRRTEAFHYMALHRAAPELLPVPFAMQSWSKELLGYLPSVGLQSPVGSMPPYKNSLNFPNEKTPYVNNVKLDLFLVLKPIVNDILIRNRSFFSQILSVERFVEQQLATDTPSFVYLYSALGVYSAALMCEYGLALFDRGEQRNVVQDLQARMDDARSQGAGLNPRSEADAWNDIVERHERSIAHFYREVYELKTAN